MRRILKKKGSVPNYIRQAVETGVYRSNAELERVWKERRDGADDLRTVMRRFRQDVVRGTSVHDYPVEYVILQQHPPIPDPPKVPAKLARRMKEKPNPTEKLVARYLTRQEQQQQRRRRGDEDEDAATGGGGGAGDNSGGPTTTEEYYRRLLGVPEPPGMRSSVGQKPAAVQKAYAAAVRHYDLQRTEGLSDAEAMRRVDELLAEQDSKERETSRKRTEEVRRLADTRVVEGDDAGASTTTSIRRAMRGAADVDRSAVRREGDATASGSDGSPSSASIEDRLRSIFAGNPRVVEGMMKWGERLDAVPYKEWTIGASTALDHWIACQLLGLSEETWLTLLEGSYDDPVLLSRGRDVVAVREALFPETLMKDDAEQQSLQEDGDGEDLPSRDEPTAEAEGGEKSIEELLASLGKLKRFDDDDNAASAAATKDDSDSWKWLGSDDDDVNALDAKVDQLVDQLQEWRRRHHEESSYDNWPDDEKKKFNDWLRKDYAAALMSDAEKGGARGIDYEATREALLSQPPVSRDDSEAFWSQLREEGLAADLLGKMRDEGPPPGASALHAAFWDLPFDEQLDRLLNIGALRPLLDEYARESERVKFLQRHGDALLAGVELEHLVPDSEGPVRASDLPESVLEEVGGGAPTRDMRFRLEMLPYQSSGDMSAQERTRALFLAWNEHKAGRARYEEKLFRTRRLGLRYSDKIPGDDDDDSSED